MNDVERKRTQKAVEAEAAARSTRAALGLLAGELGVSLRGLTPDEQEVVALRFVLDGRVSKDVLKAIVKDVRRAGVADQPVPGAESVAGPIATAQQPSADPEPPGGLTSIRPPGGSRPYRFNATEATAAKMRARLATVHRLEDARTALSLAPRRPERLHPSQVHDACLIAVRDGGTTCSRCSWLMEDDPYTDAHLDDADDRGVR